MYKRVLLKLSGEALSSKDSTYDPKMLNNLALVLRDLNKEGYQIAIVVGGGNIIRGKFAKELNLPRVQADNMGMLATLMNALALQGAFDQVGLSSYVQSSFDVPKICDVADARKAFQHLEAGDVVIYGGGTGNPFFSTDTCSALRACELNCEAILMAKNGVDGVYSADPRKDPTAVKYDTLTFKEVLDRNLGVIDATAASMCYENEIEAVVFNMNDVTNIGRVMRGERIGTVIKGGN